MEASGLPRGGGEPRQEVEIIPSCRRETLDARRPSTHSGIPPAAPLRYPPAMAQNHLYLVDGSGYIFRAYHRLPPLTNIRGEPVGAVYGYTTMLWKLADALHKAEGPTHMAVVLDKGSTSFRNELDRKSVVSGKSLSVRVDLGGRRSIK